MLIIINVKFDIFFNYILNYVLYLNWQNKRPLQPEILKEKPKDVTFEKEFKIKKEKYIICGNINKSFKDYIFKDEKNILKVFIFLSSSKMYKKDGNYEIYSNSISFYKFRL